MGFRPPRPNINWPMEYHGGKWYHVISGGGIAKPHIPKSVPKPWKKPWTPTPPGRREIETYERILNKRTQDQAWRIREQSKSREMAAQQVRQRQKDAAWKLERDQWIRQGMERAKQQRIAQQKLQQRIRQEVYREFQAMLARNRRRNFEMQRRERERQRAGTWLGTALAGMVPPGMRRYAMRIPLEDTMHGVQGKELLFAQANRIGRQVQVAMEDFSFWVGQATNVVCAALGAAGGYIGTVGMTQAVQSLKKPVSTFISQQIGASAARLTKEAGKKSTDQVLMGCRDEAFRITKKLFQQDIAKHMTERPQRYGEIIDALFKSLVQQAKKDGLLPKTIRTAPPPLSISGTRLPIGGAVDVWDSATGVGWDVTKATVRDVAGHDVRYILGQAITRGNRKGTFIPPRNIMPDGTRLRDLRPLVYPRNW